MKRQKLGILEATWALVALVAVGGCGNAGGAAAGRGADRLAVLRDNPEALIQMRKSACAPDRCSVYSVSIFGDGNVTYEGQANVAVVGQRRSKISSDRLSELISAIDAMDFLDLPASGCVCSAGTGRQMVTLDYRPGSVQKTIVHDSGCWSAPPTLGALEAAIDRATGDAKWIAPEVAIQGPPDQSSPTASPRASIAPPELPAAAPLADSEIGAAGAINAASAPALPPADTSTIAPPSSHAAP
jgi:Domain of unknown function (DUF6438)